MGCGGEALCVRGVDSECCTSREEERRYLHVSESY